MSTAAPSPRAVATVRERTSRASRLITLIAVVVPFLGVLSAAGVLWGVALGWLDLALFAVMYVICGLGITVGYHRLFSHRSFRAHPAVRGALAIAGAMSTQGPVTQWVTDHRKHHAMSDKDGDPHSPHGHGEGWLGTARGLYHAHMGWLFRTKGMETGRVYGRDLVDDPVIRRIDRLYLVWIALTLGIPFAVAWAATGDLGRGVQALVWAGLVRVFVFDHVTWSVNSICHTFGRRDYATGDHSRNVWYLAPFTFGEAWHNNHHAFPGSARHGLARHQVDPSWWTIRLLERLGLAWDVKLPTAERRARRALRAEG
ncbi:MAG TPA: acyl-CoA desaturase [Miltoncostaeaceae bacterium]|nr:acyl-CoA desaturase [Miltoncostaeaceae bacterium]